MPITVPGRAALLLEQSALTTRKAANLLQIGVLQAQNTEIDLQQGFITETLALMDSLVFLDPPGNFAATIISGTEIDLSFDDNPDADAFVVEQGLLADYSDAVEIYNDPYVAEIHITGLTSGVTYHWRSKATAIGRNDSEWVLESKTPS